MDNIKCEDCPAYDTICEAPVCEGGYLCTEFREKLVRFVLKMGEEQ